MTKDREESKAGRMPRKSGTRKPTARTTTSDGDGSQKSRTGRNVAKTPAKATRKQATGKSVPVSIDQTNSDIGDWRERTLDRMRALILQADPEVVEDRKWRKPSNAMAGVPVWSRNGIVCTGETYRNYVKLTFARGASVADPSQLFNSSLEGNMRRAIDIHEGESVDESAFRALVKAAIAQNIKPTRKAEPRVKVATATRAPKTQKVVLLSGGNPQIAKADGDAPVQAYIAAMPGWKKDIGRWLDELIMRNVPHVRKAVKWNTPFYGIEGQGWFLGFHCLTKYVKVAFFRGTSLRPVPPGASKNKETRYIDLHENDRLDETQMAIWVKQAAALPGWIP